MKAYISFFILFFSFNQLSSAQSQHKVIGEIEKTLTSTLDAKDLKDSIALYAFSIQIHIKKSKGMAIVSRVSFNDIIAKVIFKNINLLKKINYIPFLTNKTNAVINIPVAYIVANYKANDLSEKKISLIGLQDNLYKLFNCTKNENCNTENNIYLKPIVITADKAVYD